MNLVVIAIYIVLGLIGLGLLGMLLFGVRSLVFGKVNPLTMAFVCVPFAVLVVLGFVLPSWAEAGIVTVAITLAASLVALFASGIKGLFS